GKLLADAEPDMVRELLKRVVEQLMSAEVDALCGATYKSRSESRENTRNGYRMRPWDTRVGTVELAVPRVRSGSYFPHWLLEPRRGGAAVAVQATTTAARTVSTGSTAGLTNPIISFLEAIGAVVTSLLAVFAPVVAVVG